MYSLRRWKKRKNLNTMISNSFLSDSRQFYPFCRSNLYRKIVFSIATLLKSAKKHFCWMERRRRRWEEEAKQISACLCTYFLPWLLVGKSDKSSLPSCQQKNKVNGTILVASHIIGPITECHLKTDTFGSRESFSTTPLHIGSLVEKLSSVSQQVYFTFNLFYIKI